nr:class II aldolase/adducin family protein [Amycolatopsis sp. MtRt-6]
MTMCRNHGAVTTGTDLTEAVRNAEFLEWLSSLYMQAAQLGEAATLTAEQLTNVLRGTESRRISAMIRSDDRHVLTSFTGRSA